jgi:hypothetical protein
MTEEALASLQRAVEIDGPTRATDLLEAELHLMTGDAAATQVVINRLRRGQPDNPAVEELAQQLRNLRSSASPVRAEPAPADEDEQDSPASPPVRTTAKLVIDWTEWAAATGQMRGVTGAVAFDSSGQTLASHAQGEATHATMEIVSTLFGDVEVHLRKGGWGTLQELRIEMKDREIWTGRVNDFIVGLAGNLQGSFGEVRRRALETAAHAGSTPPGETADDPSDSANLTEDGQKDMPQTAPGDDGARDKQGNTHGV